MSERTHYFRIGLFTLGSILLFCIGLIMFGAGTLFQGPPVVVETYFTGSAQGLDAGAQVKMSGVRVGKVTEILFVKDVYGSKLGLEALDSDYTMIYVKMELENNFFPRLTGKDKNEVQAMIDFMAAKRTFRAKLEPIGITGLVYVELGFYNPEETPPPVKFSWQPKELYIPSTAGISSRLGPSLEKFLNKLDSHVYPMLDNLSKTSNDLPALTSKLNEALPHIASIAKNVDDITSTGKKYPSQMIFGDAPPKSRFDQ